MTVAVRPEKIRLSTEPPEGSDGKVNCARSTVKNLSYFGSYTVYHLELPK